MKEITTGKIKKYNFEKLSKRVVLGIFCLLFSFLEATNDKPFLLFTIPKAGTHLANKLFQTISQKKGDFLYIPPYDFDVTYPEEFRNGNFYFIHYRDWSHHPHQIDLFKEMELFVIVRDPRDVLISSVYFFKYHLDTLLGESSFDERLAYLIESEFLLDHLQDFFGPYYFFQKISDIREKYNPTLIRFEDIVGPNGGGDLDTQLRIIREIGRKLGKSFTRKQAFDISKAIYGKSPTFREGKIGAWRTEFTPYHIELFKKSKFNQILLDLNYESSPDW
jgi:hypothetical protein